MFEEEEANERITVNKRAMIIMIEKILMKLAKNRKRREWKDYESEEEKNGKSERGKKQI